MTECSCRDNHKCLYCQYKCCEHAKREFCVCLIRITCPSHGSVCHGSHS